MSIRSRGNTSLAEGCLTVVTSAALHGNRFRWLSIAFTYSCQDDALSTEFNVFARAI